MLYWYYKGSDGNGMYIIRIVNCNITLVVVTTDLAILVIFSIISALCTLTIYVATITPLS